MKCPLYIGEQTPFGRKVAAAPFDRFLPAQSWEMPVERELPAKIRWCKENLAGRHFDFREKSSRENFPLYILNILSEDFTLESFMHEITLYAIDIDKKMFRTHF